MNRDRPDRPLRRPWISRDDYLFFIILAASAIIHLSMAGYLGTVEIRKREVVEAIKAMPKRFARLILLPAKGAPKRVALPPRKEIAKEEARRVARKEVLSPKEVAIPATKEASRLRYKGLLGVMMAKARPEGVAGEAVFREIDRIVKEVKRAWPEKEVVTLPPIDTKGLERVDIPRELTERFRETRPLDTGEILREKKEMPLEEAGKDKIAALPSLPQIRRRDEEEVYRTVLSYAGGIRYLYNNALRKEPGLKGKATVRLAISPEGKVREVSIVSSTVGSPELEESIVNRIYRWRFTEIKGVEDFTITYTFDFSPVS